MTPRVEDGLVNRPRQRMSGGKQTLVVRESTEDSKPEILERLIQVESSIASVKQELNGAKSSSDTRKLDTRTLVALAAIALSIAGYVIQDARNTSRQDAEIEITKTRVSNLERIAASNTESRIRTEVELKALRDGQEEIKSLLQRHDNRTKASPKPGQ
jgi:hypothetical protein